MAQEKLNKWLWFYFHELQRDVYAMTREQYICELEQEIHNPIYFSMSQGKTRRGVSLITEKYKRKKKESSLSGAASEWI